MKRPLEIAAACSLLLAGTMGVMAHVPLVDSNGTPLRWGSPSNVGIVINSAGSDDLPDGSHETALRMAIAEWNGTTGTSVNLVENTTASQQARTDWPQSSIHLILFDESNTSGMFPTGTGIVALTPVSFVGGTILDADILFNGNDFTFTTSGDPTKFDVQDVATHELGHLLGLDHSGWAGATMYPFVDKTVILHRSLSEDEVAGLRVCYPSGSFGTIQGTLERASDNSPVLGANVVARDANGRPAGSVLSGAGGGFSIGGLDPGMYTVYAVPLGDGSGMGTDAPVDAGNLGAAHTIQTDFQAGTYGAMANVVGASIVGMGTLSLGGDTTLNLGTEFDRYPIDVVAGTTTSVLVRGAGLLGAGATLTASDPDLVLSSVVFANNQGVDVVSFDVMVPAMEPAGHVDLAVTLAGGETSILPAALEITPPAPTVTSLVPVSGTVNGGTAVTITGTNFNPGARVVIGDQIYTDGVGGTTVTGPTQITLTTNATAAGTPDVVVIDATGIEGRRTAGFQFRALPVITSVFPAAGSTNGGTRVTIAGTDLETGGTVRINGVDQAPITYESSTRWSFTVKALALAGPQTLQVMNPSGATTNSVFTYVAGFDPTLTMVVPDTGNFAGGQMITLTGTNFTAQSQVFFGADPDTGLGGLAAAATNFVDANTLEVVTPNFVGNALFGSLDILVQDAVTQQASMALGAFSVAQPSGGGGGGSCTFVPVSGPRGPETFLAGMGWALVVLTVLIGRARRMRRAAAVERLPAA